MSTYTGDFIGFTLGDYHSSQLNIVRVTNGDRYTETLTPNFSDSTQPVPGGDGSYYWNTAYTQKVFTIDFAFDDLRDEDIRRLKQQLTFNGLKSLIFDECSYKKYYVKSSSPPVLKYIPFCDNGSVINYKGEGVINLVAYYPYAISTSEVVVTQNSSSTLNNLGDMEAPIKIYYTVSTTAKNINISLQPASQGSDARTLSLTGVKKKGSDNYICINTKTHLIEGMDSSYKRTGTLYNECISSGDFFLIPLGQSSITSSSDWENIKFNYLYY